MNKHREFNVWNLKKKKSKEGVGGKKTWKIKKTLKVMTQDKC